MVPSFLRRHLAARHLPADDAACGWLEPRKLLPPARRLQGSLRCDFAVIGAGFTGLAAARRLAENAPGARIAILDAQRAGFGASGRSSGFLVDLAGFIAAMPEEHGERYIRLSRAGIEEIRRLVRKHGIDCDWDERGFLHVAAGAAGARSLDGLRRWLERRGEEIEVLDRKGVEAVTGTSFYQSGVRLPGSVLVQAGALVRGLAATLPASIDLFEDSPVRSLAGRGPYVLDAGQGTVSAERVIVALNGYAPGLGVLSSRVFPLLTFGSLTRPLTGAEQARLGGETEWGVLAQDPMGSSVRRTRDQRLLIRNYVHYDHGFRAGARQRERALELHRRAFRRRFPSLGQVGMESTWSGVMGISSNYYPFFGRLGNGAGAAGGYTACGIAMGTISGRLLADFLTGFESALLDELLALPGPRRLPPRPLLRLGLPLVIARKNAAAGDTL